MPIPRSIQQNQQSDGNAVNCIQKDNCNVETVYEQINQGVPPKCRKKEKTQKHQKRLKCLCSQYLEKEKTLPEFMEAIGNCVRLN